MENSKPVKKVVKRAVIGKTATKKVAAKKVTEKETDVKVTAKKAVAKKASIVASKPEAAKPEIKKSVAKAAKPEPAPKAAAKTPAKTTTGAPVQPPAGMAGTSAGTSAGGPATTHAPAPTPTPSYPDLSAYWRDKYGDNRLVLMIRDPYWCFAYWDLAHDKKEDVRRELQAGRDTKLILRVYDVTDIDFNGRNAHKSVDIDVNEEASNWYINVWSADRSYVVDLGMLYRDGRFVTMLRSNVVTTPRDSVSPVIDEEWMVVDETFDRLYHAAGATELGRSSEAITKYMLKRVRAEVSSGGLASMGSGGRPKPAKPEQFWLVVHTELIVYGATEPDANVTIQGKPLRLNPDGTFSVRYALPDGKQVIPVRAVNAAGTQERQITPIVEKKTE